jgi:hypothetical protein
MQAIQALTRAVFSGFVFKGSPGINGKEPYHEGHQVHKGGNGPISRAFSFVTCPGTVRQGRCVSFVVEDGFPVKNGRTFLNNYYDDQDFSSTEE